MSAGSLGFSVMIFFILAVAAIGMLVLRRKYGGELGGATRKTQVREGREFTQLQGRGMCEPRAPGKSFCHSLTHSLSTPSHSFCRAVDPVRRVHQPLVTLPHAHWPV